MQNTTFTGKTRLPILQIASYVQSLWPLVNLCKFYQRELECISRLCPDITFIALYEYCIESHSIQFTHKLYNYITCHKGSEQLQSTKSTYRNLKILNIKKYSCQKQVQTWQPVIVEVSWRILNIQAGNQKTTQVQVIICALSSHLQRCTTTGCQYVVACSKISFTSKFCTNHGGSMHPLKLYYQYTRSGTILN